MLDVHVYIFQCMYIVSQGHFVKNLGSAGDKETETEVLLLEHDVPHQPFSQSVLSFLPKMPWSITEQVIIFNFFLVITLPSPSHQTLTFLDIPVYPKKMENVVQTHFVLG